MKVLQIKNRFRGHPDAVGYRERQRQPSLPWIHRRAADSPSGDPVDRRTAARRVRICARDGPDGRARAAVENTTCIASARRQGVTYLRRGMVPAALSVVIGWLYVDAFVFKGANLIVRRADLLPTRGFGPPTSYCECTASFWPRRIGRMPICCVAPPVSLAKRRGSSGTKTLLSRCSTSATSATTARCLSGKSLRSRSSRCSCSPTVKWFLIWSRLRLPAGHAQKASERP